MSQQILGLHHVTAIASDPQSNVDFYIGVLGLRLVKRTVNFDDPGTYHLYYGDETGRPGTILTFFPWPHARRGQRGVGQATVTSFSIPEGSLGYWQDRLQAQGLVAEEPRVRFDEAALTFLDPDGLKLELVAHAGAERVAAWAGGPVPERHAVRGFHSVTLTERSAEPTAELLTQGLGLHRLDQEGGRTRFGVDEDGPGGRVDIVTEPGGGFGHIAAGTVHHVAWRTADNREQEAWRQELVGRGLGVSAIYDRQYFRSIYFREPGGVLFEIATDPPGFGLDERPEELGAGLKLPPWLESQRLRIEAVLPAIEMPVAAAAAERRP